MKSLVLYNMHSGKNKIDIDYIANRLSEKYSIDFYESTAPKSITNFIIKNGNNYNLLVVIGGDGTINEAINGLMKLDKKPKIAIIPSGTCNDTANTLGIKKNIKSACDLILEDNSVKLDILKANEKYFIYGIACGLLSEVSYLASKKSKRLFGRLAYFLNCINLLKKTNHVIVDISVDDKKISGSFAVLLGLKSRYLAGFKLKNNYYLNNGFINLVLINKKNKLVNIIDLGMYLLFGDIYKHNVKSFECERITIDSKYLIDFNTDGEKFENQKKVNISIINEAIEVIASKKTINNYKKD